MRCHARERRAISHPCRPFLSRRGVAFRHAVSSETQGKLNLNTIVIAIQIRIIKSVFSIFESEANTFDRQPLVARCLLNLEIYTCSVLGPKKK
jgi:hypothetical protein